MATEKATEGKDSTRATDGASKRQALKSGRASGAQTPKPVAPEARAKRAATVSAKAEQSKAAQRQSGGDKGLADLFEHALKDMYYAEKKIYKSLPKMIKAADHPDLKDALASHREETAGQIETLEAIFDSMGKRAKAEKCDAIDGILLESEGLLEDFGSSAAADAAIIFSCQAVEHYEMTRYSAMSAFADALGLDAQKAMLDSILAQETKAEAKLTEMAEGSVNDAAAEYDDESEAA